MKTSVSLLLTAMCAVIGWALGMLTSSHDGYEETSAPRNEVPPPPATESAGVGGTANAAGPIADRVENLLTGMRSVSSATEMTHAMFELVEHLPVEDFPQSIAAAMQSSQRDARVMARMISSYWAERDLPAATAWLKSLPIEQQIAFAGFVGGTWGNLEANGILDWLEELPGQTRGRILESIGTTLSATAGQKEPARVAKMLGEMPASRDTEQFSRLFGGWARSDPAVASAKALEVAPGAGRTAAVETVARQWATRDPEAAKAWVFNLPDPVLSARAVPAFALGLAESDPRSAAEFIDEHSAVTWGREALMQIARRWGRSDPEAAIEWSRKTAGAETGQMVAMQVIDEVATSDPEKAANLYLSRGVEVAEPMDWWSPGNGAQALSSVAQGLFTGKGIDAVVSFADKLPETSKAMALGSALTQWAWSDSQGMAAWAVRQPEGEVKTMAVAMATQQLAFSDPQGAASWARKLPPGDSRDGAIAIAGAALLPRDPSAAEALFRGVTGETARSGIQMGVWQWLISDETKAREWIQKTTLLTNEERESLRDFRFQLPETMSR